MRRAAAVFANPSSPHAAGRAARSLLENAREEILSKLGGRVSGPGRDRLVFTSGATEANQMAVAGLSGACLGKPRLFHSARDHAGTRSEIASLANTSPSVEPQPLQGSKKRNLYNGLVFVLGIAHVDQFGPAAGGDRTHRDAVHDLALGALHAAVDNVVVGRLQALEQLVGPLLDDVFVVDFWNKQD